jgi:hypothetical protein
LHAWHWPQDAAVVLQHTPSTQEPTAHCAVEVHDGTTPGAVTFTVNVICDWLFDLSLALQMTVVLPTGNTLGDDGVDEGGVQVTERGPST